MTDKQRVLFSEILILNLEYSLQSEPLKKWDLLKKLRAKRISLRRSMGVEQYEKLIKAGRKQYGIEENG